MQIKRASMDVNFSLSLSHSLSSFFAIAISNSAGNASH